MARTSRIKSYLSIGEGTPRRVTPRPKDWAFKRPSEGREGKQKKTRVRMKERGWSLADLNAHLAEHRAGLPDCRWTITCAAPARRLTATDYIYIRCAAFERPHEVVVVEYNEQHRVLNIASLDGIIPSGQEEPKLGEGTLG